MALWSDGRERSDSYHGNALELAIAAYFDARNEEERIGLIWDNEDLRKQLAEQKPSVMATAAGG